MNFSAAIIFTKGIENFALLYYNAYKHDFTNF